MSHIVRCINKKNTYKQPKKPCSVQEQGLLFTFTIRRRPCRVLGVAPYKFLHPDHCVPSAELIPTIFKRTDKLKTQLFMKFIACISEILVLFFSDGDACLHIFYALRLKRIFKRGIQQRTHPIAATAGRDVYRSFDRPVIRRPVFKL